MQLHGVSNLEILLGVCVIRVRVLLDGDFDGVCGVSSVSVDLDLLDPARVGVSGRLDPRG